MIRRILTTFATLLINLSSCQKKTTDPDEAGAGNVVKLQDPAQQADAAKVGRTDILTAPTGATFHGFALPKNNKIVAITNTNIISIKAITANPATTAKEDITIDKNMVDFSTQGSVDCWNHNNICVVCGYKGCITINVKDATHSFLRYWYHRKYNYTHTTNGERSDEVWAVKALKNTAYFFTAESMAGDKSAGFMRWDTNSGNQSCHDSWTANYHSLEGIDNYEYDIHPIPYTNTVALSSTGYGRIWIFNNGNLATPWITLKVSPLTNGAGYLTQKITSVGLPRDTIMVSCNRYFSDKLCFSFNYTDNKIRNSYRTNLLTRSTTQPAKISLVNIPQSYIFVVAYEKKLYVFNDESTITEDDKHGKINRWWMDDDASGYTRVDFTGIRDEEHYQYFMLSTSNIVRWIRFYEDTAFTQTIGANAEVNNGFKSCHRNCFNGEPTTDICDRYLLRAQHCKIFKCSKNMGTFPNYMMTSNQNGPMMCVNPEMRYFRNEFVGVGTHGDALVKYYSATPYHSTTFSNSTRKICANVTSTSGTGFIAVLSLIAAFIGVYLI